MIVSLACDVRAAPEQAVAVLMACYIDFHSAHETGLHDQYRIRHVSQPDAAPLESFRVECAAE
jgi:hypothetical protein